MARNIVILDSAKADFREIKKYVKKTFGDGVWNTVNAEYKAAMHLLENNPDSGRRIDELNALGIENIRYLLIRQTRMVYEFDQHMIIIHMFIHARRDFQTHLFSKLFNV